MTPKDEVLWLHGVAHCQTNYRTVASRAYYACFNRLFGFAVEQGWRPSGTGDDHGGVVAYLKGSDVTLPHGNLRYRIGATLLPKLKKLRREADYLMHTEFTKGYAGDAVTLMTDIMKLLDTIEGMPASA